MDPQYPYLKMLLRIPVAIEIATTEGMDAVAEFERQQKYGKEKAFKDEKEWNYFKKIFTKTSIEGFIAARNALRTYA